MTRRDFFSALPNEIGCGKVELQVNYKHIRIKCNCSSLLSFFKVTANGSEVWIGSINATILDNPNNKDTPSNQKDFDKNLFFDAVAEFLINEHLQKELILDIEKNLLKEKEELKNKLEVIDRDLFNAIYYCKKAVAELDERFK